MTQETLPSSELMGTVVAVQANFYRVSLDGGQGAGEADLPDLLCTRRARLKKLGQQVMVGDRVMLEEPDWQGLRGAIAAVYPRSSELQRPPIANANQALLVFSLADPIIDPRQLSRFLVAIESTGLQVLLGLSKADLVSEEIQLDWGDRLRNWGYATLPFSTYTGLGIEKLQSLLQHHITVLAGPSGVGKSSLINALVPSLGLRTGEVSERWRKGKHTTRHVELFDLDFGGFLADTPGFNQPTLTCLPDQLIHAFPEGRDRLKSGACQFNDCLHRDEPGCAVQGEWERYEDYLTFLEEALAYQTQLQQTRNPEARTKLKSKTSGTEQHEPKLETKRYRRQSRRSQVQDLDQLYKQF
jgi:ribosome biogenesis GTPase / thiamine phosphate phosphatase